MLKKRKRRKVNRRHTEPGLGAASGVDASEITPAVLPSLVPPAAAVFTDHTPSAVNNRSLRGSTALRSEAAMGASQITLHTQVAMPSERRPVTPTPYLLHDFTLEDRFVDCGSGPELAPLKINSSQTDALSSSSSSDFLLNMSPTSL
ncbi:unnamed protein product [Mesocestoides corti]|uniref:Uncharacterized protein n=1 Tax=Mesocestoides corti TaxID=53468 RepID=A0A0R3ULP4_MESCO|nr:unnamed protein product [Mesocestoides corti]